MSTGRLDGRDSGNLERDQSGGTPASAFAQRLFSLRLDREHTTAFAKRLGVSRSQLNNWANDDRPDPKISTLTHIAEVTGVRLEWLAAGRGDKWPTKTQVDYQKLYDDFAIAVKTVEEAAQGFGWRCTPAEKTEMIMSTHSLASDRAEAGLPEWDMGEILRRLREIHAKHSPPRILRSE